MKKVISSLMLCFVSIYAFSQIGAIQPQKQRFEFIGTHICLDTETGEYDMMIKSDNQFESTRAHLHLGKSVEEVMTSLKNLKDAIMIEKSEFKLEGYDFYVASKGRAAILGVGKLAHTAGSYYITNSGINDDIMAMIEKYNLGYGNITVSIYAIGSSYAMLRLNLNDYGFYKSISLDVNDYKNKITSFLKGEKDDILNDEQIQMLVNKIEDGTIRKTKESQLFFEIITKNKM